jgi:hypothetical protein
MTSEELAEEVAATIKRCEIRIKGVGDEQYSEGKTQKFEYMELSDLLTWALEELDDAVVYAVMLGIRFRRIKRQWDWNDVLKEI